MTHHRHIARTVAVVSFVVALLMQVGAQAQNSGDNAGQAAPVQKAAAPKPKIRRASAPVTAARAPATPAPKVAKRVKATKAKAKQTTTTQPPVVPEGPMTTYCVGVPSTAFSGLWPAGVLTFEPDKNWLCGFADSTESRYAVISNFRSVQYSHFRITPDLTAVQLGKHGVLLRQSDGQFRVDVMLIGGYYLNTFSSTATDAIAIASSFVAAFPPSSTDASALLSTGECPSPVGPVKASQVAGLFGMPALQESWEPELADGSKLNFCTLRSETSEYYLLVQNLAQFGLAPSDLNRPDWAVMAEIPNCIELVRADEGFVRFICYHPRLGRLWLTAEFGAPNQTSLNVIATRAFPPQRQRLLEIAKGLLAL